jgi:hypothetical protein
LSSGTVGCWSVLSSGTVGCWSAFSSTILTNNQQY